MRCYAPPGHAGKVPKKASIAPVQRRADPLPQQVDRPAETTFGSPVADGHLGNFAEIPVRAPNRTGLPGPLKAGLEALAGFTMDDVRVHRNSSEPARLGGLAFARGTDIHLGPGQERHLPHEAWHVVQQKQGRVTATTQLKAIGSDDDAALEAEADRLGSRAAGGVGSSPAATDALEDTALQPPEPDHALAAKVRKAKARVEKEAKKNKRDYLATYLALRSDPTLWDDYGAGKSDAKMYVYLPSYDPPQQPVNFEVPFEFNVPIGLYTGDGMNYPKVTMSDVLKYVDPVSAQSIRKAIDAKTVKVTVEAVLALDSFKSPETKPTTTDTIKPITTADVTDSGKSLVPSGSVGRDKLTKPGEKLFRLTGTVTAAGTEKLGMELLTVDRTCPKEIAVKGTYP